MGHNFSQPVFLICGHQSCYNDRCGIRAMHNQFIIVKQWPGFCQRLPFPKQPGCSTKQRFVENKCYKSDTPLRSANVGIETVIGEEKKKKKRGDLNTQKLCIGWTVFILSMQVSKTCTNVHFQSALLKSTSGQIRDFCVTPE